MDAARLSVRKRGVIVFALWLPLAACGPELADDGVPQMAEQMIGDGATGVGTGTTTSRASGAGGKGSTASKPWMPMETPKATAGAMSSAPKAGSGGAGGAAASGKTTAAMSGGSGGAGGSLPAAGSGSQQMAVSAAGAGGSKADGMPGELRWLGRVDDSDPAHVLFSWAGSGFAATVKGTSIAVHLENRLPPDRGFPDDAIYYVPVIDGEPGKRIKVSEGEHVVTLAEGLSDGEHQLELYRDTEGDGPMSVFSGFAEGEVVGAPKASGRFFEIVGDSITAGFGSAGMERHGDNPDDGCGADHSTSSWFLTYEAVAARALDAEVSTVARSGYGMVRGYGMNKNVMPPLFDHTQGDEDEPLWSFARKPAALIINLGTNDWNGGDPGSSFETAYIKFVEKVRAEYPDTLILLTIGPTLEDGRQRQVVARLERVVSARRSDGDDKIDIFDIGIQDTAVTGCGWHPSEAEHKRVGMVLADELRMRLNW